MRPLSQRWCRSVPSLRESALRAAFLRSEILRYPVAEVAGALDDLCGRAEQADPLAREVLAAAVPALGDEALSVRVAELREHAQRSALLPLGRLLRRGRAEAVSPERRPDERHLATDRSGRVLTLGERKALARRPSRAVLDKLLRDPHPMVIRNLLANPRMTEEDVMRLAARRPAYAEVIAEIARHPSFSQRTRVRMAIVLNPGSPPEVAVPMVRLLIRPELLEVVGAPSVAPIVRSAAKELLERRPPVPERRDAKLGTQ
jgi:hypothetical protein